MSQVGKINFTKEAETGVQKGQMSSLRSGRTQSQVPALWNLSQGGTLCSPLPLEPGDSHQLSVPCSSKLFQSYKYFFLRNLLDHRFCLSRPFDWPWLLSWLFCSMIHCFNCSVVSAGIFQDHFKLKERRGGWDVNPSITQTVDSLIWLKLPLNLMRLLFLKFKWYGYSFSYFWSQFSDYQSIMWQLWESWKSKVPYFWR